MSANVNVVREVFRFLLVVAFLSGGIVCFVIGKDPPGYVLIGAASNAFPGLLGVLRDSNQGNMPPSPRYPTPLQTPRAEKGVIPR